MQARPGPEPAFPSQKENSGSRTYFHSLSMMTKYKPSTKRDVRMASLSILCPTCDAKPGKACALHSGQVRSDPHRDRRRIVNGLSETRNKVFSDPSDQ